VAQLPEESTGTQAAGSGRGLASLVAFGVLVCHALPIAAELLPISPLPPERSLWVNLEILPADRTQPLPEALRQIESGRLQAEEAVVNGRNYRKTSLVLPLSGGDRREVVLLLVEEDGHMRMLGFHRIRRHLDSPQGNTIVFQSGAANPLNGEPAVVPPDTYTHLALCTALSSFASDQPPLPVHLWFHDSVLAARILFDGKEELAALGTHVATLRVRLETTDVQAGEAIYWFAEAPPHALLQYRGPGDFLTGKSDGAPRVLLRATASSEQVRTIFRE